MTVPSCVAAAITLINDNIEGLTTVVYILGTYPTLTPEDCPAIVIHDVNYVEKALSGEVAAINSCDFDLDFHLFMYFDPSSMSTGYTTFTTMVENIKALFRSQPFLSYLANTSTTQVLIAGKKLESTIDPWVEGYNGSGLYHAMVRVHIMEISFYS